jgi:hypothetical protein
MITQVERINPLFARHQLNPLVMLAPSTQQLPWTLTVAVKSLFGAGHHDCARTQPADMKSPVIRHIAICLCLMAGPVLALDLGEQDSIRLLNQLDEYGASTCQIIFNDSYTCSGVLINNTREAGRPLILTAAHCIERETDLNSIVVTFGRGKLLKNQPYQRLSWSSHTGASLLSSSTKLDFALIELNANIPLHVAAVFLGWNKMRPQATRTSSIYFPAFGDIQYAFSITESSVATFEGLYSSVADGHWRVDRWTQGNPALGSSGAPLLNSDFEIIGGLSGSTDWANYTSDYFFRFDLAYDHFGNIADQLKAWIDPDNAGSISHYRPSSKIRNYTFTSRVTETINLFSGATVYEGFPVSDGSMIHGVYVNVGKIVKPSGSTITVALSQDSSELSVSGAAVSDLSEFSEHYIPLVTPPSPSRKVSVSLSFNSTDPSAYIAMPKTGTGDMTSYFIGLNSSNQ